MSDSEQQNAVITKMLSTLIEERIKADVIFDVLIEKGIVTKKEITEQYQEKLIEKRDEYSADSLGMTMEEYRNIVK